MGGELLDGVSAGVGRDGEGVELDDLTGTCGLATPGQASGVRPEAPGGARPVAAQARDRGDRAALHQGLEDAARGALACRVPVASQQDDDLGLAPHRVVGACLPDGRHQRRRPGGPARGVRAARARLEAVAVRQPPPPVEGRSRNADGVGGRSCGQAVGPGLAPALKGVAPVRFVAPLLAAQARRQGGSSCNLPGQAEGLHGGSPSRCLFDTNSVGDPRPYIKGRVSHLSERGHGLSWFDYYGGDLQAVVGRESVADGGLTRRSGGPHPPSLDQWLSMRGDMTAEHQPTARDIRALVDFLPKLHGR